MIGTLLEAVRDHLRAGGRHVEVGVRPADVTGAMPFAVVYSQSARFDEDDVESVDEAGDHLVQVQTWASTFESARLLSEALDGRLRDGSLSVPGHVALLVKRDQMVGPTRDDGTYPEPSRFRVDCIYRLLTEPDTDS